MTYQDLEQAHDGKSVRRGYAVREGGHGPAGDDPPHGRHGRRHPALAFGIIVSADFAEEKGEGNRE